MPWAPSIAEKINTAKGEKEGVLSAPDMHLCHIIGQNIVTLRKVRAIP